MLHKSLFYTLALQDVTMDQTGGHPGQLHGQELPGMPWNPKVRIRLVSQQPAEHSPFTVSVLLLFPRTSPSGNTGTASGPRMGCLRSHVITSADANQVTSWASSGTNHSMSRHTGCFLELHSILQTGKMGDSWESLYGHIHVLRFTNTVGLSTPCVCLRMCV